MNNAKEYPETVVTKEYWEARKGHYILRRALPIEHPEHLYNWFKREYPDLEPEWYGVYHPDVEMYKDMTRDELMVEVMKLAMEVRAANKALEMFT